MTVRRLTIALACAMLVATTGADVAAEGGDRPSPQSFEVAWKRRTDPNLRPGIEGWVYNPSGYRVSSVLLRVQVLDADRVVSEKRAWVYGHIPAGGRGFFVIPVAPDDRATYRIVVDSFDLISRESP
ncbi:MAG: hypothetical protein HYU41_20080 [Candidatus Rokubacteria bacterium]|nr:hypothetical protein [Candidatus Rokubacteria bacterium]